MSKLYYDKWYVIKKIARSFNMNFIIIVYITF